MSQVLAQFQALANEAVAEQGFDMNEAVVGGGGGRLLPEGYAFGRFVEYIEYGQQPQEFGGKAKEPALEFSIGFALWGEVPDPANPGQTLKYHNDDGSPYIIRTYNKAMSRNEKAGAFLLFKSMNWKGTAKGFAQMIGDPILVKIKHVPKSKTDPKIVSRIDEKAFLPPLDPVTRAPYNIPAAPDSAYRMFLWGKPTKAGWDSLFVEGQYEARDGKPAASKNRIQETILKALDFQGSPLQQLLGGAPALALPSGPVGVIAAPVVPVAVQPAIAAPVAPVVAPVAPVVAAPIAAPAVPSPMVATPAAAALPTTFPSSPALPVMGALPTTPVLPA